MKYSSVVASVLLTFKGCMVVDGTVIGLCDKTQDCDVDSDCAPGLLCADAHKPELTAMGWDPRKANCGDRVTGIPWNWEVCYNPTPSSDGFGDPHFRTYDGTKYSFHGQCDLVMARSDEFADGMGIDIHARTEMVNDWSLISSLAVKIGDDIFELTNDNTYYLNGNSGLDIPITMAGGKYSVSRVTEHLEETNADGETTKVPMEVFTIDLGETSVRREYIRMQNYKSMISVHVDATLPNTAGMLGVHGVTGMVARDMSTQIVDANEMGLEWQVRPDTDPRLFHDASRAPQFPETCILPSAAVQSRRRLRVSQVEMERARAACSKAASEQMLDFCVQDVLRTGDIGVVNAYAYSFAQ